MHLLLVIFFELIKLNSSLSLFQADDPYLEVLYCKEWHNGDGQDYHLMWEETTPEHIFLTALEQPSLKGNCPYSSAQDFDSFLSFLLFLSRSFLHTSLPFEVGPVRR